MLARKCFELVARVVARLNDDEEFAGPKLVGVNTLLGISRARVVPRYFRGIKVRIRKDM